MFVPTRLSGLKAELAAVSGFALIGVIAPVSGDRARISVATRSLADFKKTLQMGAAMRGDVLDVTFCRWAESTALANLIKEEAEKRLAGHRGLMSWFAVAPQTAVEALEAAARAKGVHLFGEKERMARIEDKVRARARQLTGGR